MKRSFTVAFLALCAAPLAAGAQEVSGAVAPAPKEQLKEPAVVTDPVVQPLPSLAPPEPIVQHWTMDDAEALLGVIRKIDAEGLDPADYDPKGLAAALLAGEGIALDEAASKRFVWLAEDLRDGRTPLSARRQWFVNDPDAQDMPTATLLADALQQHDVAGVLAGLAPTHPDYALLKTELAGTPAEKSQRIAKLRANMERWRWLPRELGSRYLMVNVPEYMLRFSVNGKLVRTYRTVVGKPGRTATPQLAEMVEGIIFNPTWTVPQSIVKGEGLGARLLANPASARAQGYKVTRGKDGYVSVVQQPGPTNSLGIVKLDMPNPHAIFLHDTPAKHLFDTEKRAYSHGCIRVEDAQVMAMTLAIFGNMQSKEDIADIQQEIVEISASGEYTQYELARPIPVYITYFTVGPDSEGALATFEDIYERDAPILASLAKPRGLKVERMLGGDEIVPLEAPGA